MVFIRGEMVLCVRKYCAAQLGKSVGGNSILLPLPASPAAIAFSSVLDIPPHSFMLIRPTSQTSIVYSEDKFVMLCELIPWMRVLVEFLI